MDNTDGSYADDSLLTVFYQLLGVAPQLAVILYEPALNEAVRSWLNDVWFNTSTMKRRWLTALYYYYGLMTPKPMTYVEVGTELGVTGPTARQLVARGLRHLWLVTDTERATDPERLEQLLQWALVANEWKTCDPTDNRSIEWFKNQIMEDGTIFLRVQTPKTPTSPAPNRAHRLRTPVLLHNPEYALKLWPDLGKTTVVFKRRGDLSLKPVRKPVA